MPVDLLAGQDQQTGVSSDESRIMGVLNQNSDKNFVQRILKPEGQPTLDLGGDDFATHKMAWATANGKPIVYPEVIQDAKTGKLKELSTKDALDHAIKTKQFITMKNNADADWFSSNYKKVWDMDGKNITLKKELSSSQQPIDLLAGMDTAQQPSIGQNVESLFAAPGQTLLEAGQTLSRLVQGLPGAQPLARGIVGAVPKSVRRRLAALQVKGDILPQAPTPVKLGGALLGGGTAAELGGAGLGTALEGVPALSKIAQLAERFPKIARTAGTTAFGALASPGQRERGALLGAGLGTAAEAVGAAPQVFGAISRGARKILSPILPHQEAANILDDLSGGKGIEENAKEVAKNIKSNSEERVKTSNENFENIKKAVGNKKLFQVPPKEKPSVIQLLPGTVIKKEKAIPKPTGKYNKLSKSTINEYTPDLKILHKNYLDNPTFENAKNLRTELGAESARAAPDVLSRRAKQAVIMGKKAINDDMFSFLNKADKTGNLSNDFQDAIDYHRKEVIPYRVNKTISQISKGKITNPKNISNTFKFPEGAPEESEEAQNYEKTLKVANDLGQSGKNKILFNEIAGLEKKPQKMVDAFEPRGALDKKGFNEYITPELRGRIKNLGTKVSRQKLAGIGAGVIAGKFTGLPIAGEALGGVVGRALLPKLLKGLPRTAIKGISQPSTQIGARNLQLLLRSLLASRSTQQREQQ